VDAAWGAGAGADCSTEGCAGWDRAVSDRGSVWESATVLESTRGHDRARGGSVRAVATPHQPSSAPSDDAHAEAGASSGDSDACAPARTSSASAGILASGASPARVSRRLAPALAIALGAILLRVVSGVGFANYDTLYALVWGRELAHGRTPQYGIPIAPTPHPLVEALGFALSPLSPRAIEDVTVALGFLVLAACAWAVYRLGALWFDRPTGAVAALLLLTRVPILSYGVRAYVDVPYLLLALCALIVETRRRRAGAPVLALLALAGLLRPEAWAFSGLYWLYLAYPRRLSTRELAWLALLAASAPLIWVASDWLITGDALWSLTNTRHTALALGRETGIAKVPQYIPRRIGEILGPAVIGGAAIGGVLTLLWQRRRALLGALAGVTAVLIFAVLASVGLPIVTRYAFLPAAILCIFCAAALCGWRLLDPSDRRRRTWIALAVATLAALLAFAPSQYRTDDHELHELKRQQGIQNDLVALVEDGSINPRCEPVGVPNHAPIPLLALWLDSNPSAIVSAQADVITHGTYVEPADAEVRRDYILDRSERAHPATVPAGFSETRTTRSWLVFQRCAAPTTPAAGARTRAGSR
jgi:hypothetical protein